MRRLLVVLAVMSLVGACGSDAGTVTSTTGLPSPTSTEAPALTPTTHAAPPGPTVTTPPSTSATTLPPGQHQYTVDRFGHDIDAVLTRSGALGSGCAPGTETLPDGLWFGWVDEWNPGAIEFDLACLWPGRELTAAGNDSAKLRNVPVAGNIPVYTITGNPVDYQEWDGDHGAFENAPGLPNSAPVWVFVNNGAATEILVHPVPVTWARQTTAWPGLVPGCCALGDIAPASPDEPWPTEGFPADGFYHVWVKDRSRAAIEIEIRRWLSCAEHPGVCPDWWTDENVTVDPEADPLGTTLPYLLDMTVVILPISSEVPIVGDGQALRALLDDLDQAMEAWLRGNEYTGEELEELAKDPSFPFGSPDPELSGYPIGFRGPGGSYLTYADDPAYLFGWTSIEIRDGRPILYIHAGLIAG